MAANFTSFLLDSVRNPGYYKPDFLTPKGRVEGEVGKYVTEVVTDKALTWLKKDRDNDRPFMLMVQHKAPHRFWLPPIK